MQLFRPMWLDSVNEQFYIDYPHLRPDPEVENRKVQEKLAQKPQVLLQAAYDMVREQPWYGAGQQGYGNMPVVAENLLRSGQMPVVPESWQRNGNMPIVPENQQRNGQMPVVPVNQQRSGDTPVVPVNWQVPAAQGSKQTPVPSRNVTDWRFRALTAPPVGQTGTATASMFPDAPTSDAKSDVPLIAYSATSRKNRKLAEKRAAKPAELENRPEHDVLPADAVSQQAEEADVDMQIETLPPSPVIMEYMRKAKNAGTWSTELGMAAGLAFIEDMDREAENIQKQIHLIDQQTHAVYAKAEAAIAAGMENDPSVLEENRLRIQRRNILAMLQEPELIKRTLSKYRKVGYPTEMTSGYFARLLFESRPNLTPAEHMDEEAVMKWVAEACAYYPTEWLTRSMKAGKMQAGRSVRGHYTHSRNGQLHSILNLDSEQDDNATSFHEIVHRFEQVVPGLLAAEQAYYLSRTAGEAVVALKEYDDRYRSDEYTRPDHFADPYMGKDYAGFAASANSNRPCFELCSTGFQYLFTDVSKLKNDTHMIQWLFGLLLLI